ncbi:MAG: carboxyl-terminal processing protease [Candidatus Peribacteria bacterium]|nr:carboxyl-terminal processing protease [Candidatus Peribacteria bacterium]
MASTFSRKLLTIGVPVLTLVFGWHLGRQYEYRAAASPQLVVASGSGKILQDPPHEANLSGMWAAWKLLSDNYIDPSALDSNKLTMGAAQGLVRAVGDPYTVLMPPKENKSFHESMEGALDGIGAELVMRDDLVVVVAPLKGSPAEKAGLLPEDIIFKVNGEQITSLTLDEVITRIRGKKGTPVTLTVYHKNDTSPHELTIMREHITVPSVETKTIDTKRGPLGYLALRQFGDNSMTEVHAALADFQKNPKIKGLILDLRFNGGGYLDGAQELTSQFVANGAVVKVVSRNKAAEILSVTGNTTYPTLPLTVLINEGSASASEIVAGALQDYGRAKIIGMKSFGKGSVQDVIELGDGSSLRVTIAHWFTPNGHSIAKLGITPDITVQRTAEDYKANKDPQLDAAVAWLAEGKDVSKEKKTGTAALLR